MADASLGFGAVADGMGGQACGEIASAIALQMLYSVVSSAGAESPPDVLIAGIRAANSSVRSEMLFRPECNGMGSTLVAVLWRGSMLHMANVGDSRGYLFRDGKLTQLSYDQNLGNEMRDEMGWSDDQVRQFPQRAILTTAIGATPEIAIRETSIELQPGDQILLCSDGLYGPVPDSTIRQLLIAFPDPAEAVTALVQAANENGGPDNITVLLLGRFFENE